MGFPTRGRSTVEAPFRIPADFVRRLVILRPDEIAYGYREGWIDAGHARNLALELGEDGGDIVDQLRGAPSQYSELDRPDFTVPGVEERDESDVAAVWRFLALAWGYDHMDELGGIGVIDIVYEAFDHPEDIRGFVPYLPAREGDPTGPEAVKMEWRSYLDRKKEEFASRSQV